MVPFDVVTIHFFCLCPLSLAIKLNFNISKVTYSDNILRGWAKDKVQKSLSYRGIEHRFDKQEEER